MRFEVAPRAAVIIPAYQQPGLLPEAIVAALRQSEPTFVVVVIDGCPLRETLDVASSFSSAYPERVFVVLRRNGGLSAARNTGIEFVLESWPQVEAVMFLDADNRIAEDFMARALAALRQAPEDIGWVYPDIDMIGLDQSSSMRGEFSYLALLDWNYCDAGSVVRRSVLESGLRFDESLRSGFEDWDFWLQAAEAGLRGQHLRNAGFGYRRRGESMISAASRRREIIVAEMNRKRRALLRPRKLFELELKEAPRFAIVCAGETLARFSSDPAREGEGVTLAEMARRLAAFVATPGADHFPPFICFASREALDVLQDALILASVFWLAQVRLRESECVRFFLCDGPGVEARLTPLADNAARRGDGPALISRPWRAATKTPAQISRTVDFEIRLPQSVRGQATPGAAEAALDAFLAHWRACPTTIPEDWRTDIRPPRNDLPGIYERLCMSGAPLPLARSPASRGDIGFVIPIHSFGGVEKVVANQARVLRRLGFRPHLFITSGDAFVLTAATRESFVSVNLLLNPEFDWSSRDHDYFGAPTGDFERRGEATFRLDALGLLGAMDVVIDTHSLGAHGLAARLREWGVRMFTALHLVDRDDLGAPIGNPHVALAYEHAYDRILVISKDLRTWCLAHGFPEERIVLVRNAPSYPSSEPVEAVRQRRAARSRGPLRILFLGRLDPQKGLDRLAAIIAATRGANFAWRVIGKAVLAADNADVPALGVEVEPVLHEPEELDAAYDWADVLVMPSRFEGAPLTILEARRRGVVVLAADVGAVAETIGEGGYLVDPTHGEAATIGEFVERLNSLAGDRDLLETRWRSVLADPPPQWEETMAELIAQISRPSQFTGASAQTV